MAEVTVLYWRDIPAQVIAKAGRKSAKVLLPPRFEAAIDRAAMKAKLRDTDSYLAEWRRGTPLACGEDLDAEARKLASALERDYGEERLARLVESGGLEARDRDQA